MRGAFVVNKYYTDNGIEYVASRLSAELGKRGHTLEFTPCPTLIYDENCSFDFGGGIDYVIFWNKDYMLARALEKAGIKVFNNSRAIEICDDKAKTYLQLFGSGVKVPRTVVAPVVYDVSEGTDSSFIARVENYLGYPVVVKENTGSQGRQVYLAQTRAELISLHASLLRTPHIFQRYEADERGVDIRVYVVGGKAVNHHLAFADRLQGVHAAQEGAFPRAGWADDAHHFLRFNIAADAAQHVAVAEALM